MIITDPDMGFHIFSSLLGKHQNIGPAIIFIFSDFDKSLGNEIGNDLGNMLLGDIQFFDDIGSLGRRSLSDDESG